MLCDIASGEGKNLAWKVEEGKKGDTRTTTTSETDFLRLRKLGHTFSSSLLDTTTQEHKERERKREREKECVNISMN